MPTVTRRHFIQTGFALLAVAAFIPAMTLNTAPPLGSLDPRLVAWLQQLQTQFGAVEIVSAQRAAEHDDAHSLAHASGRAVDIRVEGVSLKEVQDAATAMQRGNVSFYPDQPFIHLDVDI